MAKRRNKQAMLRRAFEHVGFSSVNVEQDQYGDWYVNYKAHPENVDMAVRRMGLHIKGRGEITPPRQYFVCLRWRVAFECWYQKEIGIDG